MTQSFIKILAIAWILWLVLLKWLNLTQSIQYTVWLKTPNWGYNPLFTRVSGNVEQYKIWFNAVKIVNFLNENFCFCGKIYPKVALWGQLYLKSLKAIYSKLFETILQVFTCISAQCLIKLPIIVNGTVAIKKSFSDQNFSSAIQTPNKQGRLRVGCWLCCNFYTFISCNFCVWYRSKAPPGNS